MKLSPGLTELRDRFARRRDDAELEVKFVQRKMVDRQKVKGMKRLLYGMGDLLGRESLSGELQKAQMERDRNATFVTGIEDGKPQLAIQNLKDEISHEANHAIVGAGLRIRGVTNAKKNLTLLEKVDPDAAKEIRLKVAEADRIVEKVDGGRQHNTEDDSVY